MKASLLISGSSSVESTMIGMRLIAGSARYRRTSSSPSTPGMTRSCRITVGFTRWAVATASAGLAQ
jgi:hypothetical protein